MTGVPATRTSTLTGLLASLDDLDGDGTLHARRPWTPDSDAVCVDGSAPEGAASGLSHLLEVELVHDVAQVWSTWRGGRVPTPRELAEAVVHYAENDSYVPAD